MSKQIKNLIDKYGAEELKSMIDDIVAADVDKIKLKKLCSDDTHVSNWFRKWAERNNLTVKETYNGRRLDIVEMSILTGPYVVLWLTQQSARHREPAYFELGGFEKLWWVDGYEDLTNKLDQILKMRLEMMEHILVAEAA